MLTDVSKEDPKPGRWILPIIIAALIGFTYVFVNALPAADIAAATTTTLPPTTITIAPTTTSSTLPTEILAFLQELDRFENLANDVQTQMDEVNDAREDGGSVGDADAGFEIVKEAAQDLANQVAATSVPDVFDSAWPDTISASQDLVTQAQTVIDGLHAPDDGTLRRAAVAEYTVKTEAFNSQIDVVRGFTP
ncbi:MAG: hypothetical protein BMS9Abin12_1461 [Acidimicrobiia bacterium]|nr:MAG: hypothetical protein BMS9Abin12_1461 [Acidimicrobiia bacterium]